MHQLYFVLLMFSIHFSLISLLHINFRTPYLTQQQKVNVCTKPWCAITNQQFLFKNPLVASMHRNQPMKKAQARKGQKGQRPCLYFQALALGSSSELSIIQFHALEITAEWFATQLSNLWVSNFQTAMQLQWQKIVLKPGPAQGDEKSM